MYAGDFASLTILWGRLRGIAEKAARLTVCGTDGQRTYRLSRDLISFSAYDFDEYAMIKEM